MGAGGEVGGKEFGEESLADLLPTAEWGEQFEGGGVEVEASFWKRAEAGDVVGVEVREEEVGDIVGREVA